MTQGTDLACQNQSSLLQRKADGLLQRIRSAKQTHSKVEMIHCCGKSLMLI